MSADPYDTVDSTPGGSGIKYTWAYDEVGPRVPLLAAPAAARGTRIAVVDTGADVTSPSWRANRGHLRHPHQGQGGHRPGGPRHLRVRPDLGRGRQRDRWKGRRGQHQAAGVRASRDGNFTSGDLVGGIEAAIARGASVINLSLSGPGYTLSQLRVLETAFYNDVLPVAASGNNGTVGNPLEFPAAARGRHAGDAASASRSPPRARAATHRLLQPQRLREPRRRAPGPRSCELGVFSILPAPQHHWDDPLSCSRLFGPGGARFAYGQAPLRGPVRRRHRLARLAGEPRLASEQVADVLVRSARQTVAAGGTSAPAGGWWTARRQPRSHASTTERAPKRAPAARRHHVAVRLARARDPHARGGELAGHLNSVLVSREGRSYALATRKRKPLHQVVRLKGSKLNAVASAVCDRNGDCAIKRLGKFRLR